MPRVSESGRQSKACLVHGPTHAGNQRRNTRVDVLENEEQNYMPHARHLATAEAILPQQEYSRIIRHHRLPHGFRGRPRQQGQQVRCVIRFGLFLGFRVAGELFEKKLTVNS